MLLFLTFRVLIPRIVLTFIFLILIIIATTSLAQAHTDHQEIQVKSTFQVNQNKQLHAITLVWQYDTTSSQDMLTHEQDLKRLSKLLISDIARFNYFTRLNAGDQRLVTNKVSQYNLIKVKNRDGNPALRLTFTLLLNRPLDISSLKNIKIDHADPTGRGILFYVSAMDIILTNELKSKCRTEVINKKDFIEGKSPQLATISCST